MINLDSLWYDAYLEQDDCCVVLYDIERLALL